MPPFKRPALSPGALRNLIEALHDLHMAAGFPSARTLADDLGIGIASHTTIHKAFTAGILPTWGLIDVLSEAMAVRAGRNKESEVERIRVLWQHAADPKASTIEVDKDGWGSLSFDSSSAFDRSRRSKFLSEIIPDTLVELEAIGSKDNIKNYRIPTGIDDLDVMTGGWSPGSLVIVGGPPASGKTALLVNFSASASINHQIQSMFVSAEERHQDIILRIISSVGRVSRHWMRTGQMSDDDWGKTARAMVSMANSPMTIIPVTNLSIEQVKMEAKELVFSHQLRLLAIDGLASFVYQSAGANDTGAAIRELKHFAQEANIAIVLSMATDLIRDNMSKTEEHADVLLLIETGPSSLRSESVYANISVAKNRYGPEGKIAVDYEPQYSRFADMTPARFPVFPISPLPVDDEKEESRSAGGEETTSELDEDSRLSNR